MQQFVAPVCILLALAIMIAAFILIAQGDPEPSVALQLAQFEATNLQREQELREQLGRYRDGRRLLIVALAITSVVLIALAFKSMRPAEH